MPGGGNPHTKLHRLWLLQLRPDQVHDSQSQGSPPPDKNRTRHKHAKSDVGESSILGDRRTCRKHPQADRRDLTAPSTPSSAATGTAIGMLVALVLSALVIYRSFGVFIAISTWLRAALAAGAGYAAAAAVPDHSAMMAIVALGIGFLSSVAVLLVTREVTRDDLRELRRIVVRD